MKSGLSDYYIKSATILLFFSGMAILPFLVISDVRLALVGFAGLSFLIFILGAPVFWLAVLLVVVVPFHSLIVQLLGGRESSSGQLFAFWKEALIIVGLLRAFLGNSSRASILRSNLWVLVFTGALAVAYAIAFFRFPSVPAVFSINLETRFIGVLIFFMLIPLERKQVNLLLRLMVASVAVVAAYGVIQYFWDYDRLLHLVSYDSDVFTDLGRRLYSFSLNSLEPAYGAVIAIIISLAIWFRWPGSWRWSLPALVLFISCLMLTYTRSAYLGLIAGAGTLLILDRRQLGRHAVLFAATVSVICAVALLGGGTLLKSNFVKRLDTIVSLKDPSSLAHKTSMEAAIDTVSERPWGIGLGKFGILRTRFEGEVPNPEFFAENWVLQVGVQTGLIGALAYIFLTLSILFSLVRRLSHDLMDDNCLGISASGVFVAMTVAGILIPVWDSLLTVVYTWALVGMGLRPYDA